MKNYLYFLLVGLGIFVLTSCNKESKDLKIPSKPNIILLNADDLGYGDIGVNGAKGVKTPNIDKLAQDGLNFTDAHSTSATCTPSRYSLLTGSYAFRRNAEILPGTAPLNIDTTQNTLPLMLQKAGYLVVIISSGTS